MSEIDLAAYFARIGYSGPASPTLETLRALHRLHPTAIAFENLDPALARPVLLAPEALHDKLILRRRGGYCYEQNGLFYRVLRQLGFAVTGLSARVLRGPPRAELPERSHMALKVMVGGEPWLADVGFGTFTLTAPLRLDSEAPQETPHGSFRLTRIGNEYEEHAVSGGTWETLYRFGLEEQLLQDYESPNWYRSTHPGSLFVQNLIATRPISGRRLTLFNNRLTETRTDTGENSVRLLGSAAEIAEALSRDFGIVLPEPRAELERALAKFVSPPSASPAKR